MINFIRQPFDVESSFTFDEISQRVDDEISEQRSTLYKKKGQPMFVFSRDKDKISMNYYQAYKNDMCDTMYQGELKKGLEGCQLIGGVKKPRTIWVICVAIACSLIIDLLVISLLIVIYENFNILDYLLQWFLIIAVRAVFIVQLLRFDRRSVKLVKDKITEFMQAERNKEKNEGN